MWYHKNKINRARTVTTLHTYAKEGLRFSYGRYKSFFLVRLWKIAISGHDQVVVLSRDAIEYYKNLWNIKNITFVYNGINDTQMTTHNESGRQSKTIKIGAITSAGGINPVKGIDQTIKAVAGLSDHMLYIAGKDTSESAALKELAQKLEVSERIHFLGHINDIASFINKMDLFVLASRSEGLPLSLLEIARAGKPIVCSKIPIFKEIMSEDEVVFFQLDNIESLKNAIKKAYKYREVYANNVYKAFISQYTTEKMAEKYLKVYQGLLDEK